MKAPKVAKFDFIHAFIWYSTTWAFAYLFAVTFIKIPVENKEFANIVSGAMITAVLAQIYNFVFGSSKKDPEPTSITKTVEITEKTGV
jgi:hypothetical protein